MRFDRLTALRLLGAYFVAKAAALLFAAKLVYDVPEFRDQALNFAFHLAPIIALRGNEDLRVPLAVCCAAFALVEGIGLWCRQNWARVVILVDISYYFARAALGLFLLSNIDRTAFLQISKSPWTALAITERLVACMFLLDPDTSRVFKKPADSGDL